MTTGKAHPRNCHEGSDGEQQYSSIFSLTSALDGDRVQCHVLAASPQRKDLVPTVQKAGRAPGPTWIGVGNLAPTRIQPPDCPAHIKSQYRLHYHK